MKKGILLLLIATPYFCFGMTGNELIVDCDIALKYLEHKYVPLNKETVDETAKAAYCISYVEAVADYESVFQALNIDIKGFCPPKEVTPIQAVRVIDKYLHDHPADLYARANSLAIAAASEAFPCKK